jgi:hypothetical protein
VVGIDLTLIPNQVMSPNLKGMHYGSKFQIMGGIIRLVGLELAGSICHYFPILHENTSQPLSGCVAIYDKIPLNVWQGQHWGCGQSSLQPLETSFTRLSPVELLLLLEQLRHGSGNLGKSFNEPPIIPC